MTNQSMGYLVDELERRGYIKRVADPSDRRASLVVPTRRGRELIATARRLIEEIERDGAERIGTRRMAALQDGLDALAASLGDDRGQTAPAIPPSSTHG